MASASFLEGIDAQYLKELFHQAYLAPQSHFVIETLLIGFIIYILSFKQKDPRSNKLTLTPKEQDALIAEWEPEPIAPPIDADAQHLLDSTYVLTGAANTHVTIEGESSPKLNLATFDFLSMGGRPEIKETAVTALDHYGLGSCGPRGFYGTMFVCNCRKNMPVTPPSHVAGTIDAHVNLEQSIADWLGFPESIIYSDSANTPPSVIPAFSKRGDLLVIDDGVSESIRKGQWRTALFAPAVFIICS
jgi:serine palmitoyltransferase